MEYNRLNINSKKSWLIARGITTVIITSILFIGKWFLKSKLDFQWIIDYEVYVNIGIAIIMIILLLNTFLYPIIEYKQWKYLITDDKVDFTEGIYSTSRIIIPIIRIQHIKVEQGPINRIFNLANIQIVTAGGSHIIPNIEMEKAEEISEYLKNKIRKKVEGNERCREN